MAIRNYQDLVEASKPVSDYIEAALEKMEPRPNLALIQAALLVSIVTNEGLAAEMLGATPETLSESTDNILAFLRECLAEVMTDRAKARVATQKTEAIH